MKTLLLALALTMPLPAVADDSAKFDKMASDHFDVDEAYNHMLEIQRRAEAEKKRVYQCVARNGRRQTFLGKNVYQGSAQREAMVNCQRSARFAPNTCRLISCRLVWK